MKQEEHEKKLQEFINTEWDSLISEFIIDNYASFHRFAKKQFKRATKK